MYAIQSVLKTMRFSNLLIICTTSFVIRHTIIKPFLENINVGSSLSDQAFALLVLAMVLISAGGYIINDYFDVKIDAVNKPGKNLIGKQITRSTAIVLYLFLTISGIVVSYFFGEMAGIRYPILVFLLSAGLLYFYSSSYKTMLITGNMVISLLAALSIFITILFDKTALQSQPVLTIVTAYTLFAFLMTLVREIIKDCEDSKGDSESGASTLPLTIGLKPARIIAGILTLVVFSAILRIQIIQSQWQDLVPFIYVTILIQLPLLVLAIRCFTGKSTEHDHINSMLSKVIMVTGIFSMLVFHISF
jgi:4-hydroxybenzoate polyprenyltransferase